MQSGAGSSLGPYNHTVLYVRVQTREKNFFLSLDQTRFDLFIRRICTVDHFLIESWQNILDSLEDQRASVNVVSLDFEKAFNRMDHGACVEALLQHGAPDNLVIVIRSFLTGRTMSVKIGKTMSAPRKVNGGSPQGSIWELSSST